MTLKKLALAGVFLAPVIFAQPAEAREYCREYQKTITVGGHYESGYGTACLQPDGSWMIVSTRGNVDPFDALRTQNVILVSDSRPVYYAYGPSYRPVTYYPRHYYAPRYYQRPGITLSFTNIDRDRHWHGHHWKKPKHGHAYGHRDNHRNDHRGRGRNRH